MITNNDSLIRGCIFDLDGVVVDTARYHYLAWNRLARDLGFEFTVVNNERLKGVSRMSSLDILLEIGGISFPDEEKQRLASLKNEWYVNYISKMTPAEILPGVMLFLRILKDNKIRIALGTASKNAAMILKQIGLEKTFDCIIDGNLVTQAKPDPEVFLKAAAGLGLSPALCVVFEDAIAGIEAAHRGGMRCIGVGKPDVLAKADKVIPGFVGLDFSLLSF
ncbi:MAG: beta-phosphoglucomutase [Bacteroidota bacterium]